MIKFVAITGGIGAGKSVISKIFACLGVPIYNSDNHAKFLMENDATLVSQLTTLIGEYLYKDSHFQKDVMAHAIFSNPTLCTKVNSIVHPRVWEDYKEWSNKQHTSYTMMESALLFESDLYKNFDKSIMVVANEDKRVQRVMQRENCSANKVLERIKNQSSTIDALNKVDFIIENNDTFVIPQVLNIHNELIRM